MLNAIRSIHRLINLFLFNAKKYKHGFTALLKQNVRSCKTKASETLLNSKANVPLVLFDQKLLEI